MRYVIITPAKDEEDFIRFTLESVISQTVLPIEWIIVNDGSSDGTGAIISEYESKYSWIRQESLPTSQQERSGGSKVINAFNTGFAALSVEDYEFIVKLDADLTMPANYFEYVSGLFTTQPVLGLCGGYCVIKKGEHTIQELSAPYHVRGAFKAYRKSCFQAINGLRAVWGWDGVDEMDAMYKGWKVCTFDMPVLHHRPTSKSYNPYKHAFRTGLEHYRMRSSLLLTLVRTVVRLGNRPYILGGNLFLMGYLRAAINQEDRILELDLVEFINNFHMNRVYEWFGLKPKPLLYKTHSTQKLNERHI